MDMNGGSVLSAEGEGISEQGPNLWGPWIFFWTPLGPRDLPLGASGGGVPIRGAHPLQPIVLCLLSRSGTQGRLDFQGKP